MVKSQGYFPSYVRNITSSNDDIRNMIDAELQGQRQQICLCHGVRRLTIPFCFRRPLSMHVACQNVIRPWQWKGWPSVVCATKIPTNYFELNNQTDDHMYYHCIISVLPLYYFSCICGTEGTKIYQVVYNVWVSQHGQRQNNKNPKSLGKWW